jgi:hypothetical protein
MCLEMPTQGRSARKLIVSGKLKLKEIINFTTQASFKYFAGCYELRI